MTVLVTGAAGFIGAYTCQALAARGERVVGLDNHNDYYDPQLKRDRVAALCPGLDIRHLDLVDRDGMAALFDEVRPDRVVHLAAQAGDPDHHELVEVVARDGEEAQPLQQRVGGVHRFFQHPRVEGEPRYFAVQVATWPQNAGCFGGLYGNGADYTDHATSIAGEM